MGKQRMLASFAVEPRASWLKVNGEADDPNSLVANAATFLDMATRPKGFEGDAAYVLSDATTFSPAFARRLHKLLVDAQEELQTSRLLRTLTLLREATDMASLIAYDNEEGAE